MRLSPSLRLGALLAVMGWLSGCGVLENIPQETSPYRTEQEWVVSSVCRNAFELLAYARDKKGEVLSPGQVTVTRQPGDLLSYQVTAHGANVSASAVVTLPDSIWDASAYLPFCRAAAQALGVSASGSGTAQGDPLHALLDFSERSIEDENQRISQWLSQEPENPNAQEQAALVLGMLAMKDNSGFFWDPRDACNHATAHLAIAGFLRGDAKPSVEGQMADILVGLIADTKTKTGRDMDDLSREPGASPDLVHWLNAGRMRNSRDWRIVPNPENATPFEQVEYFRALGEATEDTDQPIAWLQAHSLPDRPEWSRIVLEEGFSVSAGHQFATPSIGMELKVMRSTFPDRFQDANLIEEINRVPGDVVGTEGPEANALTVINRGMWAQFFQRHLCQAIAQTGEFFANDWGVPQYARALDQAVAKDFYRLTLYPKLEFDNWQIRQTRVNWEAVRALFSAHPEWLSYPQAQAEDTNDSASREACQMAVNWFQPPVLGGTAYDTFNRLTGHPTSKTAIDRLYAIAPLQFRVAELELRSRSRGSFTLDDAKQVLGTMLDYYVPAIDLAREAPGLSLDQKIQLSQKSAAIDPDGNLDLAHLYLDSGQDDLAAQAYQNWYDKATDRVAVSDNIGWLVDYYYAHGQTDKALAIANEGAQVYSSAGLETMMRLMEKMGRIPDAESYGQKILDRYNEAGPLVSFYKWRVAEGDAQYQEKIDRLTAQVFPDGLKTVTLASFSGPPTRGMNFASANDAMIKNGISADQVIVALDGYLVESEAQYTFVRGFSQSPVMHFIVWDGNEYREVTANQPGRLFGVEMQDYRR